MENGSDSAAVKEEGRGLLGRFLPLIILVALAGLVYALGWHRYLSPQHVAYSLSDLQSFIKDNLVLAVVAYVGIYVAVVSLSLPGAALLTLTGGLVFGWQISAPVTVVAATIGATVIFLVAKTSFGEALAQKAGPWIGKLRAGFQENALSYLLFLRLVPVPFFIVNLVPALVGVPLRTYVIGTFFGIIPGTFAFSYLGRGLDSVFEAGREAYEACVSTRGDANCSFPFDPSVLITTEIILALAALGVVALIPVVLKKFWEV